MKKILFALTAVSLMATMNSCKKDEPTDGGNSGPLTVEQKQRALVSYVGHSNIVGEEGSDAAVNIPLFNTIISESKTSDIVGFTIQTDLTLNNTLYRSYLQPLYYNDNNDTPFLNYPLSIGLISQLNPPSVPVNYFYNSGSNLGSSVSKSDIFGSANETVSNNPEVGIAIKGSANGNTININYKSKAYQPESGAEYYISVFVIEKDGNTRQSYIQNPRNTLAIKNIVRASAIKSLVNGTQVPSLGLPINGFTHTPMFNSNSTKGAEVENNLTFTYKSLKPELENLLGDSYSNWKFNAGNTAVVAVVWKWYPSESKAYYSNCVYADVK